MFQKDDYQDPINLKVLSEGLFRFCDKVRFDGVSIDTYDELEASVNTGKNYGFSAFSTTLDNILGLSLQM